MLSGGPNDSDFDNLRNNTLSLKDLSFDDKAKLFHILRPILNVNSLIGHTFLKPYGYVGDFELISKIYSSWISFDPSYQKWDNLYQSNDAIKAIRSRKQYFIKRIDNVANRTTASLVLNLGSGPRIDVLEYFQSSPRSPVQFERLDMDDQAIEYASAVCDNYINSLLFINTNVFTFSALKEYDLIMVSRSF